MTEHEAEQLGRKAFAEGRGPALMLDPDMVAELRDAAVGEKTHLMEAFSRGWHAANLEA